MRRVDVVVPRDLAVLGLRAIHRAGTLHLVPYEAPAGVGPAVFAVERAAPRRSPFDDAAERLASLSDLIGPARPAAERVAALWELPDADLLAVVDALEPVRREASDAAAARLRHAGDISRLDAYRRVVEGLRAVVGRLPAIRGYASTGIVVAAGYRAIVPLIREELEALTDGRCEVVAADLDGDRLAAILLYPARSAADVRSLLGGRELEEVALPDELAGIPFDELLPRLEVERARLVERRGAAEAIVARIASERGAEAAALRLVVADRLAECRAMNEAATSDHLLVLAGWLPARELGALRDRLAQEVGPDVVVVDRPDPQYPSPAAPVATENRSVVAAFAPLASFVGMPRYGSLDPTPIIALTFPAFVGLMVGDAGYGLVLLALLLIARHRWAATEWMRILWPVGLLAAIATIAFGILFGEWFGTAGHALIGIEPVWLDRREAVVPLLVLAIAIGVAQVGLGLVLGVVNALLLGHGRDVAARASLLACFVAILVLLCGAARLLPGEVVPLAAATVLVALLALIATRGVAGPVEVVGVLGNVLSYSRLMAIGLASVMLALVANRLGDLAPNVLVGVLVAGTLHALNITLGFFDASVQGLRLHYVEFFGRFLESGGVRYEPFASVLSTLETRAATTGGS